MQVPTASVDLDERAPDLARAEALRGGAIAERRTLLTQEESRELLAAFGLPVAHSILAGTKRWRRRTRSATRWC